MEALDLNPRVVSAVTKAKLGDFATILSLSAPDLCRSTQLSYGDVITLQNAVASAVYKTPSVTALQIYGKQCPLNYVVDRLITGCPVLDAFLRGGILCHGITEIAGESASGKTQFCIQLCLTAQLSTAMGGLNAGALYLCTEDVFPNRRLVQMANLLKRRSNDPLIKELSFLDKIFIEHAAELDDMWDCIHKKIPILLQRKQIRLIVIDSIAALFRCEYDSGGMVERAKKLSTFAARLHELSNLYQAPVICVNQVSGVVSSAMQTDSGSKARKITPALGLSWANLVTCRILLQRSERHVAIKDSQYGDTRDYDANVRTMEVMFAPHLPNSLCHFIVDTEGVKGIS